MKRSRHTNNSELSALRESIEAAAAANFESLRRGAPNVDSATLYLYAVRMACLALEPCKHRGRPADPDRDLLARDVYVEFERRRDESKGADGRPTKTVDDIAYAMSVEGDGELFGPRRQQLTDRTIQRLRLEHISAQKSNRLGSAPLVEQISVLDLRAARSGAV